MITKPTVTRKRKLAWWDDDIIDDWIGSKVEAETYLNALSTALSSNPGLFPTSPCAVMYYDEMNSLR